MALDPADLPSSALEFLAERHLATLTTLRPDGSPHVTPVGFTYDAEQRIVRVITDAASRKARNVEAATGDLGRGRAVVCQVDGARWLALEGLAEVVRDPEAVADAERRYAGRYRQPRENPTRVVVTVAVDRVLGRL